MTAERAIRLAKGLYLPLTAVTQTFAFMGKRGAGKTYAAGKLVEELLEHRAQVVVVDPVGNWWGLRLAANGKDPGFSIPVLGGGHGDLELAPEGGALVADVVVDTGSSLVLDVSHFRKAERQRFVTDFAEQLFHRKKTARTPIHLVFEEAHLFVPQRTHAGQERMLGAMEDLVKLGRNYGIGASLLDQRPQSVNKDVLNQSEVLLAFQLIGSQERKAIELWAEDKGIGKGEVRRLSELEVGEAIVWSPSWLRVFTTAKIARKKTFDGSATPEAGADAGRRELAAIDLGKLGQAMAAVVEQKKAADPKALKKRIAELEQQVRKLEAAPPVAVPTITDFGFVARAVSQMRALADLVEDQAGKAAARVPPPPARAARAAGRVNFRDPAATRARPARTNGHAIAPTARGGELSGPEQRVVDAVAWLEQLGVTDPPKEAVAFLAGYRPGGGAFNNTRGRLRALGLIDYRDGGRIVLTDRGRRAAMVPAAPLSTDELHRRVLERLSGPEGRILQVLLEAYPEPLPVEVLAERAGYAPGSGGFNNPKGRLRTLGLISYPESGHAVAEPLLFLEGG